MESQKVYLRIKTPFSLKNFDTLQWVLYFIFGIGVFTALLVYMYSVEHENPMLPTIVTAVSIFWLISGAIPSAFIIFRAYAREEDGELVVNPLGFYEKRYARSQLQKAVKVGARIQIYAADKIVAAMPDSPAARQLVRALRIPAGYETELLR